MHGESTAIYIRKYKEYSTIPIIAIVTHCSTSLIERRVYISYVHSISSRYAPNVIRVALVAIELLFKAS